MSVSERAFIQAGADAISRGDYLTDEAMQREFDRILADIAAK